MDIPGVERFLSLELAVRVLNVNKGHNEKILERCEVLRGYAVFIGQVREYQQAGQTLEDAITAAIDYCVASGILVEYLISNGSEVRNMLFTEFNIEDAKQVWREEAFEEGIEKGKLEDARAMFLEGFDFETISRVTKLPMEFLKEKLRVQ